MACGTSTPSTRSAGCFTTRTLRVSRDVPQSFVALASACSVVGALTDGAVKVTACTPPGSAPVSNTTAPPLRTTTRVVPPGPTLDAKVTDTPAPGSTEIADETPSILKSRIAGTPPAKNGRGGTQREGE